MPKRSWNLNTVYISERLQECLRPISRCALTTVIAPMGYGKTTAVNWYLLERAKLDEAAVVRISVYSDNLAIFWKSVQEAFFHAGFDFLRAYPCPDDAAGGSLLTDDLCHALAGKQPCYIFLDDFHLLTDNRVPAFLCTLTNRLPENVHLIVASRDRFLPAEEILRLGGRLYTVGAEQLRLNHTELSIYAHRCGTELSDAQIESLLYSSEGWFSAIYLNLRTLHERGELPSRSSDIYAMFSAAMIDPLPSKRREFLAVMGLADEFTVEMAEAVTGSKNTAAILQTLTEQNAFVKRLPDGVTFRFHHMMKDCAERTFHTMEPRRQAVYHNRYGEWYKTHGQYLHALKFYCLAKNYDAALRVIQRDAGILLTSLGAQQVLDFIAHCPVETLKEHPLSLLVLMRSMFNWRQIPKMLELKELLLAAITEHPDWPESERGDLLGECDLIMSFLMYNDISAMSRLHRSASAQMSRPAISIQKSGGWTFGSPSVLMMFTARPANSRASSPRWTSACRTTIRSQTATGRALRPSFARRPTSCAPALPTRRSCSSAPMRRLTATGRKTWPCAATFSPGGSRSALLSRRASPLSSGARRCWGCTTSHGSTFCKAPAPITMRCWDCPKKFPWSSVSINSPPSTSSRPESR